MEELEALTSANAPSTNPFATSPPRHKVQEDRSNGVCDHQSLFQSMLQHAVSAFQPINQRSISVVKNFVENDTNSTNISQLTETESIRYHRSLRSFQFEDWTIKQRAIFASTESFDWISDLEDHIHEVHSQNLSPTRLSCPDKLQHIGSNVHDSVAWNLVGQYSNMKHLQNILSDLQYRWDYNFDDLPKLPVQLTKHTDANKNSSTDAIDATSAIISAYRWLNRPKVPPGVGLFQILRQAALLDVRDSLLIYQYPEEAIHSEIYGRSIAALQRAQRGTKVSNADIDLKKSLQRRQDRFCKALKNISEQALHGSANEFIVRFGSINLLSVFRTGQSVVAMLARTSRGLRMALRRANVPFHMPANVNVDREGEQWDTELHDELETYESSSGALITRRKSRDPFTSGTTNADSAILFRGRAAIRRLVSVINLDVMHAFDVINDHRDTTLGLVAQAASFPQLFSTCSFRNCTQASLEIEKTGSFTKLSEIKSGDKLNGPINTTLYRLEIGGPFLRGMTEKLSRALTQVQLISLVHTTANRMMVSSVLRQRIPANASEGIVELSLDDTQSLQPLAKESVTTEVITSLLDAYKDAEFVASIKHDKMKIVDRVAIPIGHITNHSAAIPILHSSDPPENKRRRVFSGIGSTDTPRIQVVNTVDETNQSAGDDVRTEDAQNGLLQARFVMEPLCDGFTSISMQKAVHRDPKISTTVLENLAAQATKGFASVYSSTSQVLNTQHQDHEDQTQKDATKNPPQRWRETSSNVLCATVQFDDVKVEDYSCDALLTMLERLPGAFQSNKPVGLIDTARCVIIDLKHFPTFSSQSTAESAIQCSVTGADASLRHMQRRWPWSKSDFIDDMLQNTWQGHCIQAQYEGNNTGANEDKTHELKNPAECTSLWSMLVDESSAGISNAVFIKTKHGSIPIQWIPCYLAARSTAAKVLLRCAIAFDIPPSV